ncbi:MAG: efflux RND transporter periplasmic adaptor subunit, partial [Desulfobacteraceae bacterium]|nr:efflux RND transporter periplasmic adaptor subunit [Desulfobacteraceae bacterium]
MSDSGVFKTGGRLILPIVLIFVMLLWMTGAFRKGVIEPGKMEARQVPAEGARAYPVVSTRIPVISEAVGAVQPEYRMTISSRISGDIIEMRASAGQHVRKDDLLARLDARDIAARVSQARETLRRAQAGYDLAASDYRRDKPLVEKAVIPRSEFDQTDMRLRTAEADVQHAKEALREAEVSLSYAEIRSPATGMVIDKLADAGDLATPGKALLTMYETHRLWLEASVREQEAALLRIGAEYAVRIGATGEQMKGKLLEIVPSADPASRTVTARISLPRTDGLYPGMFGRLLIPVSEKQTLLIPESAMIRVGQLRMVDVITEGT